MDKPRSEQPADLPHRHIFVTGGSGFVGRNIIRHYLAAGARVTALARSEESVQQLQAMGAVPVRGDLTGSLSDLPLHDCDLLIHAAADTSHAYPSPLQWQVNVEGTRRLFSLAHQAGIRKAIYISSESVLLNGNPLIMADETHPLPARPAGAYSHTKAAAEQALLTTPGLPEVIIIRPRFVWGKDDTTALPQLMAAVQSGKFAWIDGGRYLTSATHIDNLCHGIRCAAEYGADRNIYFITDEEPVLFRDFVSQLLATQNLRAPEKNVPRWLVRTLAHGGDLLFRISGGRLKPSLNMQVFATSAVEVTVSAAKARRELHYRPVTSVRQGMEALRG